MAGYVEVIQDPIDDSYRNVGPFMTTPDYVWRVVGAHMFLYAGTRLKDAVIAKVGTTTYNISIPQNQNCKAYVAASVQGNVNVLADTEWFLIEDLWPSSYMARAAGEIKENLCMGSAIAKAGSSDVMKELHLKWGNREIDIPVKTRGGPDPEIALLPACTKTIEVGAAGLSIVVTATGAVTDTAKLGLGSGHALSTADIRHACSIYAYYQCEKRTIPLFRYKTGQPTEIYQRYDEMEKKAEQGEVPTPGGRVAAKEVHSEQQSLAAIEDLRHDVGILSQLSQDEIEQAFADPSGGARILNLRSPDFVVDKNEFAAKMKQTKIELRRRVLRAERTFKQLNIPPEVWAAKTGRVLV